MNPPEKHTRRGRKEGWTYQQREPRAAARALRLVDEVFERLSDRDEHFLVQVLVVAPTFTLPLVPDRQTEGQTVSQSDRGRGEGQIEGQIDRQRDRQTEGKTDGQRERQTDRGKDR